MVRKTEKDSKKLLITNCRLFDAAKDDSTTSVLVEDGTIRRVGQIAKSDVGGCDILDANGRIIAPGFIDVHIQGAGGADILDGTPEALKTIAQTCARIGTTSFLATTVFKPGRENEHLAVAAEHVGSDLGGANLLGIHLEGPFISPAKKGMIAAECIAAASLSLLDKIREITGGRLKMMTIAPELPGSIGIIRLLADAGVIASFGHSNATYEETMKGFDAGISHVTHLFNTMPSIHHRMPGPVAAIFEARHVTAQVITDGVHIHPAVVRLAFKMLGPERIVPITDAMQAMGLGDGKYVYNGIDRLDNNIGYLYDNCATACKRCNFLKGTLNSGDFIEAIAQILRNNQLNIEIKPSKLNSYYKRALATASSSHDEQTKVGALLINPKSGAVIAEGYNGFVRGARDQELPKTRPEKYPYMVHAEMNLLCNAVRHGICTDNCVIFCTLSPCISCIRMLYQSGISTVYFKDMYSDIERSINMGDLILTITEIDEFYKITVEPNT